MLLTQLPITYQLLTKWLRKYDTYCSRSNMNYQIANIQLLEAKPVHVIFFTVNDINAII
jgi:hypothetical protein